MFEGDVKSSYKKIEVENIFSGAKMKSLITDLFIYFIDYIIQTSKAFYTLVTTQFQQQQQQIFKHSFTVFSTQPAQVICVFVI